MEALAQIWGWLTDLVATPGAIAALFAFIASLLINNGWKKAVVCAFFAYALSPFLMWALGIPDHLAPAPGTAIAVVGVHGVVERIQGANIKSIINAIWKPK